MDRRTLLKATLLGYAAELAVKKLPVLFQESPKCDPPLYGHLQLATHPEANASIIITSPESVSPPVVYAKYEQPGFKGFSGYCVMIYTKTFFYPATGEKTPFITEAHFTDFGTVRVHVQNHEATRTTMREILAAEPSYSWAWVSPNLFTVVTHHPRRKS